MFLEEQKKIFPKALYLRTSIQVLLGFRVRTEATLRVSEVQTYFIALCNILHPGQLQALQHFTSQASIQVYLHVTELLLITFNVVQF